MSTHGYNSALFAPRPYKKRTLVAQRKELYDYPPFVLRKHVKADDSSEVVIDHNTEGSDLAKSLVFGGSDRTDDSHNEKSQFDSSPRIAFDSLSFSPRIWRPLSSPLSPSSNATSMANQGDSSCLPNTSQQIGENVHSRDLNAVSQVLNSPHSRLATDRYWGGTGSNLVYSGTQTPSIEQRTRLFQKNTSPHEHRHRNQLDRPPVKTLPVDQPPPPPPPPPLPERLPIGQRKGMFIKNRAQPPPRPARPPKPQVQYTGVRRQVNLLGGTGFRAGPSVIRHVSAPSTTSRDESPAASNLHSPTNDPEFDAKATNTDNKHETKFHAGSMQIVNSPVYVYINGSDSVNTVLHKR